jgi:hypothetical protein
MSRVGDYIMMQRAAPNYGEVIRQAERDGARSRMNDALNRGDMRGAQSAAFEAGETDMGRGFQEERQRSDIDRLIGAGNAEKASAYANQAGHPMNEYLRANQRREIETGRADATAGRGQNTEEMAVLSDFVDRVEAISDPAQQEHFVRTYGAQAGLDDEDMQAVLNPEMRAALREQTAPMTEYQRRTLGVQEGQLGQRRTEWEAGGTQRSLSDQQASSEAELNSALDNEMRQWLGLEAAPQAAPGQAAPAAPAETLPGGWSLVDAPAEQQATGGDNPLGEQYFVDPRDASAAQQDGAPGGQIVRLANGVEAMVPGREPQDGQKPVDDQNKMIQDARAARDARSAGPQPADGQQQPERRQGPQTGEITGLPVLPPHLRSRVTGPTRVQTYQRTNPDTGQIEVRRIETGEIEVGGRRMRVELEPQGGYTPAGTASERANQGSRLRGESGTRGEVLTPPASRAFASMIEQFGAEDGTADFNALNLGNGRGTAANLLSGMDWNTASDLVGGAAFNSFNQSWNTFALTVGVISGAAVTASEAARFRNSMRVAPHDSPQVIQRKFTAMAEFLDALERARTGDPARSATDVRAVVQRHLQSLEGDRYVPLGESPGGEMDWSRYDAPQTEQPAAGPSQSGPRNGPPPLPANVDRNSPAAQEAIRRGIYQ